MDYCTGSALEVAVSCPDCGATTFPDGGATVCPECTRFVPVAGSPTGGPLTRDAAFAKVEKLLWWHANRFIRAGRAGFGTTAAEFVSEATVVFCKGWKWFDGRPAHLATFAGFAVKRAAHNLRRQNRAPLGRSLATFESPDDLLHDRPLPAGPEPDELDALRAALAELEPDRRAEVVRAFGVFGHRQHTHAELAARAGGVKKRAICTRVGRSLDRLAELMTAHR